MFRVISEHVQHEPYLAGGVDAHGNPTEGWGTPNTVGIYAFDPGSSSEPRLVGREGMDRVIVEPSIYMPSDVVFDTRDRVMARGLLFEVEGVTREWVHPTDTGRRANVVSLRRVEG